MSDHGKQAEQPDSSHADPVPSPDISLTHEEACREMARLRREMEVRRTLEAKLSELTRRYRSIIDLVSDVVYERHVDEDVAIWAEEGLARLGYTAPEFGCTWQEFLVHVHPEDRERVDRVVGEAVDAGESYDLEYRMLDATGTYRWMRDRATIRRASAGRTVFGVLNDVTDTRVRERDVETLNRIMRDKAAQLETANRELESFSYSVSHDLRAPLRAIGSFVDILTEDYRNRLDEEGERYLSIIQSNVDRMNELIRDLLAFSRLTRQPLTKDHVDMTALAQEAFTQLKPTDQEVVWRLEPLPQAYGDVRMLRQVWINLVSNAIKYSRDRERPEIHVFSTEEGGRTVYAIRDNGIGFDQAYEAKLFAVFQRLHTDRNFEGTGVGLSIVQRIIQRHSGRIWAQSAPGEGATFYFHLA
ncbi:MAG: sensor histidine kinase [Spirochaetota bacterium]